MDRKVVKPALEGGRIWNPDHRAFLPEGGVEVAMTPYWLALEQRGDVLTAAPDAAPATAPTGPADPPA